MREVYLDHHATTPVDARVLDAMLPYFRARFGNAASRNHRWGWEAEEAVEGARAQVAALIGAHAREIVFTSGATESNNLALCGVVDFYRERGDHIVTVATEHKAVLDCCRMLERSGRARVTYLPVGRDGRLDPQVVADALTERTVLVSVMHANNEIGTLQPLREIAAVARQRGAFFHTDATQGVGTVAVDVEEMGIDLLSLSAHKIYGPKGCGALYVRARNPRVRLQPQIHGGGHERGMRSGTLNVPGIVGFGAACAIARAQRDSDARHLADLRDRLLRGLGAEIDDMQVNGTLAERLAGNLNVSFRYVEGESLLMALEGIAVSSGSACTTASLEPSHVLKALGIPDGIAQSSIRFGIGRDNTADEIDYVTQRVIAEVKRLRALSPEFRMRARASG